MTYCSLGILFVFVFEILWAFLCKLTSISRFYKEVSEKCFAFTDLKTGAVKNIGPNTDTDYTLIIAVASCVCLVVITTVITSGLVCCVKGNTTCKEDTEYS